MQIQKNETTSKKLRRRSILSFLTLILGFCALSLAFHEIRIGGDVDEAHHVLRDAFRFNETLWHNLFSPKRLSVAKRSPPPGTPPRKNGDIGMTDALDLQAYEVVIDNNGKEMSLPISAFTSLAKTGYTTDFRCIEGWSEVIQYAGLRFSEFMKAYEVGKKPDGAYYKYVGFETPDEEYYVSIDIDSMLQPQTVLAYEMNQAPLSVADGAPIRLIIPIKYGIKNIKRIGRISFSDTRQPDYWAERGYDWFSAL
jgi:DMSO/TMAO reductase YedYZ molybdopterin-dependent catalytic subunit